MTDSKINPWQRDGVSILPSDLAGLMPIVGQKVLFDDLTRFRDDTTTPGGQDLTGFFVIMGGWGVGKSRVGHEVCLEALAPEAQWIVDGQPRRLLEASLDQGILPLFLRYVQVTRGPLGADLEADEWIPRVTVEALSRLAGLREKNEGRLVKNQDRLMDLAVKALKPRGWDGKKDALVAALTQAKPAAAARDSLAVLREMGINHLWLVVDEIEDITDVERDGLQSDERVGIDQGLLTVIPRVIKAEESRQEFPEVSFLLLCSMAVGDLLGRIRAIERRTYWHELTANSFADVEAFFRYLKDHRANVAEAIASYPAGLKEAAFFAANRNFGWFNVIMHHAHENHRSGQLGTPELLESFAKSPKGKRSVFDVDAVSDFHIPDGEDRMEIVRFIYSILPQAIGSSSLSGQKAKRFLDKKDAAARPLFAKLREVAPPENHRVLAHMIRCGFELSGRRTELSLPGEARFDLSVVLDSLAAYSIGLPEDRREHLLVCEDQTEFTAQVMGLSPYPEQAHHFAPFLWGLLMEPEFMARDGAGRPREYLAPAFSFLRDFNRLNKVRRVEEGFLRESSRNTHLEEAVREVQKDAKKRSHALLKGLANAWESAPSPVSLDPVEGLVLPSGRLQSEIFPLRLGRGGRSGESVLIHAANASEADLEQDLTRLAQKAAVPILVVLEDQDERAKDLRERINRNIPRIAPCVVVHNLTAQTALNLIHLGLIGEAFSADDLRTSHFHAVVGVAKQHLDKTLQVWREKEIEEQGLLLRPLFYGSRVDEEDLAAFARGYAAMLGGRSYHELCQTTSVAFATQKERDLFKAMVERHTDPPPRHKEEPRMELVQNSGGEVTAAVPRSLISILQRCKNVPIHRQELEDRFLFDAPEGVRARDIMRQVVAILHYLGLICLDGERVATVSTLRIENRIKSAKEWLEGPFEDDAITIKRIHSDAAEKLETMAKDARFRLKDASKKIEVLSLSFVEQPWAELNRKTPEGDCVYEQRFCVALQTVRQIQDSVDWVYDPEARAGFRYGSDSLQELDARGGAPDFPLWKRLAILKGFYQDLDAKRMVLTKKIDDISSEVDRRVPSLASGEKAFPVQPLTVPLRLYRQELGFAADNPQRTISAGGTTLGVDALGFKIASGRYLEALYRLQTIEDGLTQPGKFVSSFLTLLGDWEAMKNEAAVVSQRAGALLAFFNDAPNEVRKAWKLGELQEEVGSLVHAICEGGIRQGTDDRETAGTPAFQLIEGLKEDLAKLRGTPTEVQQRLQDIDAGVLPSIAEQYQEKYRDRLNALTRICQAQNKPMSTWPDQKADTYGRTKARFDEVAEQAEQVGRACFADCGGTTFDVFVGLCRLDLDHVKIDWNSSEYQRHVQVLMDKKLLVMRLIG